MKKRILAIMISILLTAELLPYDAAASADNSGTVPTAKTLPENSDTMLQFIESEDKIAEFPDTDSERSETRTLQNLVQMKVDTPHIHIWSGWKTVNQATALTQGKDERACRICGKKETKKTSKLKATIKLNSSTIVLQMGQSTSKLKVSGLAKGDVVKSWRSGNTNITTVGKNGKITAKNKEGKTVITITLKSGLQRKVTVKVQKNKVRTKKITGVKKSLTLKTGKTEKLSPVISPITSSDKVTYSSSNKNVVTVSNTGKITAKKSGTATITVKSGKIKATCKVTVDILNAAIDGSDVTVIGDSITYHAKDVGQGAYTKKLPGVDIHAEIGKHFNSNGGQGSGKSGLTILKELISRNKVRDVLVFALGANDSAKSSLPIVEAGINELLKITDGVKKIVFVTVYKNGEKNGINKLFYDAARRDSRVVIADWAGFVKLHPSKYLGSDMQHLNGRAAYEAYVDLIMRAIKDKGVN